MGNRRPPRKARPPSPWRWRWIVTADVAILCRQVPWNGQPYVEVVAWCPAWFLRGTSAPSTLAAIDRGSPVKKRAKKDEQASRRAAQDEEFQATYPELFEYLTATCFDDDPAAPRQTSTLLLFAQDGVWKANLRDRAEGVCAWVAAPTLLGLLAVLEDELKTGEVVWRLDRFAGHPEATRKPKGKST